MLFETLQKDMIAAMKAKDKPRKEAISSLIAAVKKVAIDEGCRDDIKEELVDQVLLKELKTAKEQVETCPADRQDLKEEYEVRLRVIEEYAPKLMSAEEIKACLTEKFAEVLATKNKGQIMKAVMGELKGQLLSINEPLLDELANRLVDLNYICELVDKAIIDNPPLTVKDGGIIKDGFNEELDELRYIRDHGKQWLASFEQKEREKTGIKGLKIGYNRVFGYYIEVTKANLPLVKDEFNYTRKQSLANAERFVTPELKDMESKLLSAQDKMIKLEYVLFTQIRDYIKNDVHVLQDVAKIVAMVDVYQSMAVLSSENSYVRPVFNQEKTLKIVDGRHGIIEKVMSQRTYVSNDIDIDKENPVLLITGPNMGGKSTYMRQIALIALMGQIGCFVPCSKANIPIFDQIFTRIGASDDLISGQSTFMVEMLEANNALRYATENSLIIFDEIGRGTATFDGMAIAQSMIEYIATSIKCITLFSTHYHELTFLEEKNLGIKNVHASASIENDNLVFLYRIKPGRSNKSYGINVAKLAKLPDAILNRANTLLESLEENNIEHHLSSDKVKEAPIVTRSEVEKYLDKIDPMTLSPLDALSTLIELKKLNESR